MAYSTFTFYEQTYHGNVVPAEDFDRIADRASDFLDVITFDRLVDGLPDNERAKTKVQKAVCASATNYINWSWQRRKRCIPLGGHLPAGLAVLLRE